MPAARSGLVADFVGANDENQATLVAMARWLADYSGTADAERVAATTKMHRDTEEIVAVNNEALEGIRDATLFWATAGQTRLAASAATSLPEWSARQALPCASGLILFEESVGSARFDISDPHSARVGVDGMLWRTREDDLLVVYLLSRFLGASYLRRPHGHNNTKALVLPVHWLTCDLSTVEQPHERSIEEASFLDLISALWLLIGQDRVTTTTTVEATTGRRPRQPPQQGTSASDNEFEHVIVVDLHRSQPAPVATRSNGGTAPTPVDSWG